MPPSSRRKFLKRSLELGALTSLSTVPFLFGACESLDERILREDPEDLERVVVLGGGLAGLSTAYFLKKARIPFVLYEAQPRMGGRIYSLNEFNAAGQVGELGGEWISSDHFSVLNLIKEFKLELMDKKWEAQDLLILPNSQALKNIKLQREFELLIKTNETKKTEILGPGVSQLTAYLMSSLPLAVNVDEKPAAEYLNSLKLSGELQALLKSAFQIQLGVSFEQASALNLIQFLSSSEKYLLPGKAQVFRIKGGNSNLIQALYDRVAGVVPGRTVRSSMPLQKVHFSDARFELNFKSGNLTKTIRTKYVVCTLPPSKLVEVSGFDQLPLSDQSRQALQAFQMSTISKVIMSVGDRSFQKNLRSSRSIDLSADLGIWESEPGSDSQLMTPKSILTAQLVGPQAAPLAQQSIDGIVSGLKKLKVTNIEENLTQSMDWKNNPWSRGATSFLGKSQISKFAGVLTDSQGPWVLAGEHTNLKAGTMNAAVESAQNAVRQIQALKAKKS